MKKIDFKIKNKPYFFALVAIILIFSIIVINQVGKYPFIKRYKECLKQKPTYQTHSESFASKELCKDCKMKIPKIFHRIWTVWDPENPEMPSIYKEFDYDLKKLHPDWEFVEWDDKKIEEFIKTHYPNFLSTYLSYDSPTKKHDASRYLIVNHFGGVFIQHSIKLSKNIEPLLAGYEAVFSEQSFSDHTVGNSFFASKARHHILEKAINKLPETSKLFVLRATGPDFLTQVLYDNLKKNDLENILILPPKYLYPFDWGEKTREPFYSYCIKSSKNCMTLFPEGYGYCLWTGSWISKHTKPKTKFWHKVLGQK